MMLKRYRRWATRTDRLPWHNPRIAYPALLNGTATAEQWHEGEVYVAQLREAAVRRGTLTALPPVAAVAVLIPVVDVSLTLVRGLL